MALQQAQGEVLFNFGNDMAALAATELHPAVVTDTQKFLVDLVPADRLKVPNPPFPSKSHTHTHT
jgi:hypothetical protein